MSNLTIDSDALGRLRDYAKAAGDDFMVVIVFAERGVKIEWWGGDESGHADDATPDECLAKLLAEIGDAGPCPVCGGNREALCETCLTRDVAAEWDRKVDEAVQDAAEARR